MKSNLEGRISSLERELLISQGKKHALELRLKEQKDEIDSDETLIANFEVAINFLNHTSKQARDKAIKSIENLSTLIVRAVYGDTFSIRLRYKDKSRTDSSDKLTLQVIQKTDKGEIVTGLMDEVGGGFIETVSFGLRFACLRWLGYKGPIILDEAYKSLSNDEKLDQIAVILKELNETEDGPSNQIFFATHKQDVFGEIASKQFIVKKVNGKSIVEEC